MSILDLSKFMLTSGETSAQRSNNVDFENWKALTGLKFKSLENFQLMYEV